jgi:CheY-like chemotaxis protein
MGGHENKVRILQVEDNPLDAELVLTELDEDGLEYEVMLVDDEPAFTAALDSFEPNIVLSDLSMPSFSGERALQILRERSAEVPFIFISAKKRPSSRCAMAPPTTSSSRTRHAWRPPCAARCAKPKSSARVPGRNSS